MADEDATSSNILPQLNDAPESASTVAPSATASESIAASASAPAIRPSLVPLGGSSSQTAATPPTKKFSSVNINKKFLEKNSSSSSASGASHTAASNASSGVGSKGGKSISVATPRPQVPASTSHSRLVTTKLTVAPSSQSLAPPSAGSGWSRSPSATPAPVAQSNGPVDFKNAQLRRGDSLNNVGPGGSAGPNGRAAWGNPKTGMRHPDMASQTDFPTAAEAAVPRSTKPSLLDRNAAAAAAKEAAAVEMAHKLARMEEADTFRGVHLDPNAHHWDDMEEDDDNFLDGVLEFGDGRQYKIEPTPTTAEMEIPPPPPAASLTFPPSPPPPTSAKLETVARPDSRSTRFTDDDDFDRSWPRSKRASPAVSTGDLPIAAVGPSQISPAVSFNEGRSGMLFNERSNKFEPVNRGPPGQKRGEGVSPTESRPGRDYGLSRAESDRVQVLQNNRGRPTSFQGSRPPSVAPPPNAWSRRPEPESRGRRLSNMGPPPVPNSVGRQLPPHLSPNPVAEPERAPLRRPSTSRDSRKTPASSVAPSPVIATVSLAEHPLSGADLDEARKDVMQSAAARAKARRQQEELEREQERERARRKAAELEERMKVLEEKNKPLSPVISLESEAVSLIEAAIKDVKPPALQSAPQPSDVSVSQPELSWRNKTVPPPPKISARPSFVSTPTALEQVESLVKDTEELEVVDFAELGKFMGVGPVDTSTITPLPLTPGPPSLSRPGRPVASDFFDDRPARTFELNAGAPTDRTSGPTWRRRNPDDAVIDQSKDRPAKDVPEPVELAGHSSPYLARAVRAPGSFKEAPMTALDEFMSRVKGAIEQNSVSEREVRPAEPLAPARPVAQLDRWAPPPREEITTACEPPSSKSVWNTFTVRLPKVSRVLGKDVHVPKRQEFVRWDILSFDPPVEGMTRRDFTVNSVLFRHPGKWKPKIRVVLPRPRSNGPRVNIPAQPKSAGSGLYVRPSVADNLPNWRKPQPEQPEAGLNPVSRSPPPQMPSDPTATFTPKSDGPDAFGPARPRSRPKMPPGSSVAFYRESTAEGSEAAPVSFIVHSELESLEKESGEPIAPSWTLTVPTKEAVPGPDRELLKAVWSSNMPGIHTVNSLEAIADDLGAIPFTLQDVKSEDGGTPPPTAVTPAPSRITLTDVTRAFQVPTSSPAQPQRPSISPPSTTAPVARPPAYSPYAMPPNPMMRPVPNYGYPPMMGSPMMGSPMMSPMGMYPMPQNPNAMPQNPMAPSPGPGRMPMNGAIYSAPVWMGPQMRAGPYPPYMPYPSLGPQPTASPANAGRGRPPMSPVSPFPASPILMHAPVGGYMPGQNGHPPMPPNGMPNGHAYNPPPSNSFARPPW